MRQNPWYHVWGEEHAFVSYFGVKRTGSLPILPQTCTNMIFALFFSVGLLIPNGILTCSCLFVCLFRHDIQQLTISILVYIHTYLRTYVPKYMRTSLHMYICIHTHITIHNVLTYMRTCVLAYMRTCIHACMHTYIHIHIHIITYTIVSWLVLVAKRLVTLVKCNEYMISTWSYS
jgi:hypothetical protein